MKKLLFMLSAIILAGAILGGVAGCGKKELDPAYLAYCSIFVKTTPGEETILLAKSESPGSDYMEKQAELLAEFKSIYGETNVLLSTANIERPEIGSVPNLYEITMTADVNDDWTWPLIQKADENTRIYKFYYWSCLEERVDMYISDLESKYKEYGYGERIISSTKNNLGAGEIRNMPITF